MKFLALVPALLLCGCAANSYCIGEQPYQKAASVPPLKNAEDLKIPESPSSLRIPPAPAKPTPYGEVVKDSDGDDVVRCLDKPPELVASIDPPPAPPAPVAAPAVAAPVQAAPAPAPEPAKPAAPAKKKKKKAAATPAAAPAKPAAPAADKPQG